MSHTVTSPATLNRLRMLVEKYGPGCFYCGADLPVERLTIDEFVPRARGGRRVFSNQRPACFPCNNNKGDSDPIEWIKSRPARPAHAPPRRRRVVRASLGHFGVLVAEGLGCARCVLFGRWATTSERCGHCDTVVWAAMLLPDGRA